MIRALIILVVGVTSNSCLNVGVSRFVTNEPIAPDHVEELTPGKTSLVEALRRLGAPYIVRASENGQVVLAWGWEDEFQWSVSISYRVITAASARFRWDSTDLRIPGAVLIFDSELRLQSVRRGWLSELLTGEDSANTGLDDFSGVPR